MQSKIKSITPDGNWETRDGNTMYRQKVVFEDGVMVVANSKTPEPPYAVGDEAEYSITGKYKGVNNGKVVKPMDGQQPSSNAPRKSYGKSPEEQKQIVRQSCLKCACKVTDSLADPIQIVGLAQYFYEYCMSGEVKPSVSKAPAHAEIDLKEEPNGDDLPF